MLEVDGGKPEIRNAGCIRQAALWRAHFLAASPICTPLARFRRIRRFLLTQLQGNFAFLFVQKPIECSLGSARSHQY